MKLPSKLVQYFGIEKGTNIHTYKYMYIHPNKLLSVLLQVKRLEYNRLRKKSVNFLIIQGGPDITCQKNSGSLEGSNKSKKPHFVRSKIMGIN
jgi:hypothetical protein